MTFQTNFPLYPTKLPYVTVSSKGMSNSLSDIPNDGFDFGPDTLLGTSSKGLYGPPYTQTAGIQEAMNYAVTQAIYYPVYEGYMFPTIRLLTGNFEFSTPVYYGIGNYSSSNIFNVAIEGASYVTTNIVYTGTGNAITFDPSIYNIVLKNLSLNNPNQTADTFFYWDTTSNYSGLIVENISNGSGTSSYLMYFNHVYLVSIRDINTPSAYGIYVNGIGAGFLYMQNQVWSGTNSTIGNYSFAYISGQSQRITVNNAIMNLKLANFNGGVTFNAPVNAFIAENGLLNGYNNNPAALVINANVNYIKLLSDTVQGTLLGSTNTTTNYTIGVLSIDGLYNINQHLAFGNLTNITINAYDFKNIPSGTYTTMPTQSSTNGTTAGTVSMDAVEYRVEYKKYVITFNGYENDTTTNQTISYPLPFSTNAVITGNNTGLTISTTTSGITITAPNSTTTYSGIVIVEGY